MLLESQYYLYDANLVLGLFLPEPESYQTQTREPGAQEEDAPGQGHRRLSARYQDPGVEIRGYKVRFDAKAGVIGVNPIAPHGVKISPDWQAEAIKGERINLGTGFNMVFFRVKLDPI